LKSIYDLIVKSDIIWKSLKYEETALPVQSAASYIPAPIRDIIKTHPSVGKRFVFQLGKRTITVNITLYEKHDFFINYLHKIFMWLYVITQHAQPKCSQSLTLNLFLTLHTKTLPILKNETLDIIHVNTAFTTSCAPSTEINIFRKEEWFKVLIHETFHCFGLDFSEMNYVRSNAQILSFFPVKSDVRVFETYCEMWAEIINVIFYMYYTQHKPTLNVSLFNKLMKREQAFSLFQCVKVLRHFGMIYTDLYQPDKAHLRIKYKEASPVLSYYVLKSIAMANLNGYIEWCIYHNTTLNFTKTDENVAQYCQFFKDRYNSNAFLKLITEAETVNAPNTFIKNTLRMTITDTPDIR